MGLPFTQGLFDKAHYVSFTNLDTRATGVNQTRSLLSRIYFYGRRRTYDVLEKHILKQFRNTIKTIKQGKQNHYIIFPCLLNIYSRPRKGWKRKQATSRKGSHFIQKQSPLYFLFVHSSLPKLLAYGLLFELSGLYPEKIWKPHYKQILEINLNVKK